MGDLYLKFIIEDSSVDRANGQENHHHGGEATDKPMLKKTDVEKD